VEIAAAMSTPARASQKQTPASKSSGPRQQSILGFFQKKSDQAAIPARPALEKKPGPAVRAGHLHPTPVPSSDPPEIPKSSPSVPGPNKENGLLTPATNASAGADLGPEFDDSDDSPVRKVYIAIYLSTVPKLTRPSRERKSIMSSLKMRTKSCVRSMQMVEMLGAH
jgi:hypothetical protein